MKRMASHGPTEINFQLLLEGNPKEIDPEKPMEEQTQHLPYDKSWEFPANRLKLGNFHIQQISFIVEIN